VYCFAQNKNSPLYSNVILIYLLTTKRVPRYPLSYLVGYLGNELPDNGSPIHEISHVFVVTCITFLLGIAVILLQIATWFY